MQMDLYADNVLDHYRNPRNKKELAIVSVEHAEENVSCGDTISVLLHIEDDKIANIGWSGTGCAVSQAAMSMLTEEMIGMNEESVLELKAQDILDLLGVPVGPRRLKCALLGLHVIQNALHTFQSEPLQGWADTAFIDNPISNPENTSAQVKG